MEIHSFLIDITKGKIKFVKNYFTGIGFIGEFEVNIYALYEDNTESVIHTTVYYESRRKNSKNDVIKEMIENIFNGFINHTESHFYDREGPQIILFEEPYKYWHLGNLNQELKSVFKQLIDLRDENPSEGLKELLQTTN